MTDESPDGDPRIPREIRELMGLRDPEEKRKAELQHEVLHSRINHFLDSLDVEGLYVMRAILNHSSRERTMAEFYDGQLYSLLRCVKGVDPDDFWEGEKDPLAGLTDGGPDDGVGAKA